jgi:acyl-CoA thioesterase-1
MLTMKTKLAYSYRSICAVLVLFVSIVASSFAQSVGSTKPIQIVAFGASQTAGKIVSRDHAYPSQLEQRLRTEGFNVNVVNQGSSGDTTEDERNRLERAIPIGTDIVLFQPGTNDCGGKNGISEDHMARNLEAMLSWMKDRHLQVLVLGGGCYEDVQASLPGKYGFAYYGKMGQGLKDFPRPDGQHFTAEGYAHMVELLLPSVKKMIVELGTAAGK